MTLNGEAVTPKVSKDGDLVNISLALKEAWLVRIQLKSP